MKTETQQQGPLEALQRAVSQAAVDAAMAGEEDSTPSEKRGQNGAVSPINGVRTPSGRPKGVRNKLTNLRDAVIEAFDRVGGVDYLVKLANGTQSDRAAFTSLMNKVLPTQINQQVDGGIRLELSWLGSRSIGATTAQIDAPRTQVLDLQQDSDGGYRIKDPADTPPGGDAGGMPDAPGGPGDARG